MMKTVLVVDDQQEIREILTFALTDAGLRVLQANSADEALKISANEKLDFVITDYLMPKKNGADLVRELRKNGVDSPVFIITGYSECPRQELIELKVKATIFKPFDAEEVTNQVLSLLK